MILYKLCDFIVMTFLSRSFDIQNRLCVDFLLNYRLFPNYNPSVIEGTTVCEIIDLCSRVISDK